MATPQVNAVGRCGPGAWSILRGMATRSRRGREGRDAGPGHWRGQRRRRRRPAPTPSPSRPRSDGPRSARRPDPAAAGPRRAPAPGAPDRAGARRGGRALPGAPAARSLLVLGHRAGRARRSWAGSTTSSTARATPGTSAPASRWPTAGSTRAPCGSRSRCARLRSSCRCRSPTACTPASAYLVSLAIGLLGNVGVAAQGVLLLAALGGVVRALPGVPLLRRLGRRRTTAPRPRSLVTVAGRAARDRRALPRARCGGWCRTTRTAGPTCRCGSGCGSAPPGCSGWPSTYTALGRWSALASPAPTVGPRAVSRSASRAGRVRLGCRAMQPATLARARWRQPSSSPCRSSRSCGFNYADRPDLHARRGHQQPRRPRRHAGRGGRGRRRPTPAPSSPRWPTTPATTRTRFEAAGLRRRPDLERRRVDRGRRSRPAASSTSPTRAASPSPATSRPATSSADADLRQRRDVDMNVPVVSACDEYAGPRRGPDVDPDECEPALRAAPSTSELDPTARPTRRLTRDPHAGPAPPRRERVERQEPLHRLGRRRPHRQGPRRGRARRRAAARGRAAPDVVHTSLLRRAITTAAHRASTPPTGTGSRCAASWRLNERHYGALQGKNKKQTLEEYGEEQFMLWRRSFDVPPPPIDDDDEFSQAGDPRYADLGDEMPRTECLKDVIARFLPYWESDIVPDLRAGPDRAGRRARQQPARAGQAPRRDQRRGHRRPQHPDRHAAGLRARRRAAARPSRAGATSTPRLPPKPPPRSPTRAADRRALRGSAAGYSPVTTKTTRLATETAWSAIRS